MLHKQTITAKADSLIRQHLKLADGSNRELIKLHLKGVPVVTFETVSIEVLMYAEESMFDESGNYIPCEREVEHLIKYIIDNV